MIAEFQKTAKSEMYECLHRIDYQFRYINQGIMTLHKWVKYLPAIPASLLEFGCGNGFLCEVLAEMGYDVTGMDIAGDNYEHKGFVFTKEPVYLERKFDCVLSFDVFEHLTLDELRQIMPPLFGSTNRMIASIGCYGNNPVFHETVLSPEEWIGFLCGFDIDYNWQTIEIFQRHTELDSPILLVKGEKYAVDII